MPKSLRKVVVDTSALISFEHGSLLDLIIKEFKVAISDLVLDELQKTSKFNDEDGKAAARILKKVDALEVRRVEKAGVHKLVTSRLEAGEASCVLLAKAKDIEALVSDDFKAMHQLQRYSQIYRFDLGLGAVLIQALVARGTVSRAEALKSFERIASKRDWMGRPIYRAYRGLLEEA